MINILQKKHTQFPVRNTSIGIEKSVLVAHPQLWRLFFYRYVRCGAYPDRTRPLPYLVSPLGFVPIPVILQKIEEKETGVTAGGKEKLHTTAVPAVRTGGGELPPLFTFKGKAKGKEPSSNSIDRWVSLNKDKGNKDVG